MTEGTSPQIQDSGKREEFVTGSVRDTREGKGRFDLIAALGRDQIDILKGYSIGTPSDRIPALKAAFNSMYEYLDTRDPACLQSAFSSIASVMNGGDPDSFAHLDRLARHYEGGAKKYKDRNWELGQQIMRYFDSAVRHIVRALQNRNDEDHMAAALWNIIAIPHSLVMIERGLLDWKLDNRPKYTMRARTDDE